MTKPRWFDVAVVVLTIALGGYLVATQGEPTRKETEARANNVLPAFLPEELASIRLRIPQKHDIVLRRDARDVNQPSYLLGQKGGAPADAVEVSEIISSLDFSTWIRKLPRGSQEKRSYGFDVPSLEVVLEAGPRSYTLLFGAEAPTPVGSRYLLLEGNDGNQEIGVVSKDFFESLRKTESELRGSLLFPYGRRETSKLYLNRGEDSLVLNAEALGFRIGPPKPGPLDRPRADRTLSDLIFLQLARAKLAEHRPRGEVEKGLAAADARIEVIQQSPEGPEYRVLLGGDCDEAGLLTFAQRIKPNETFGCVTKSILAALNLTRERLIDRTALPLHADEIDHVTIQLSENKLDLIRKDAEYRLLSADGKTVPRESGDEFLRVLSSAPLLLVDPPSLDELHKGSLTARGQSPLTAVVPSHAGATARGARDADGIREVELELFVDESLETLYLHRLDDQAWLRVPPEEAWAFLPNDVWTQDRILGNFDAEQIHELRIQHPGKESVKIVRRDGHFEFEDSGLPADAHLTRRLLEELSHLEAVRFHSPPRKRPDGNSFEVEWKFADHGVTRTERLFIGARVRGGYLAWSTLTTGSFVLSLDTRAILQTPLVDRSKFRIEPDPITALEIHFGDQRYHFQSEAGLLRAQGGASNEDMIRPLKEALRNLNVIAGFLRFPAEFGPTRPVPRIRLDISTGSEERTIAIGPAVIFEGDAVRIGWVEGQPETYLISAKSVAVLEEIL